MKRRGDFWVLTVLAVVLLWAPLRSGDLAGYDDAQYAHIAKDMVKSGDWLDVRSSGNLSFQNPPLFEWMQAALFTRFGFSDTAARVPSAVCGLGVVLLVFWLARSLTGDPFTALAAMFAMVTSIYFLKYAARAMTDVPFTFFFLCAVCAWTLAEERPGWYLAAGVAVGVATMTRNLMGLSLPVIFALDVWVSGAGVSRRRLAWKYAGPGLALALLPLTAWYGRIIYLYRDDFFAKHATWLSEEVYGPLSPPWRRYTGAFEYAWMLAKSYWPWLPAMLTGAALAVRRRDRKLYLLLVWIAVVFALCSITRSRVLRYMLPAYPAFAVLAAVGLVAYLPQRILQKGWRAALALFAVAVAWVVLFPRTHLEATEIRPLAIAASAATPAGQRVVFYDAGQRRYDEANQMEWYGDRFLAWPEDQAELIATLDHPPGPAFVMDEATYTAVVKLRIAHQVLGRSGHLICFRLQP